MVLQAEPDVDRVRPQRVEPQELDEAGVQAGLDADPPMGSRAAAPGDAPIRGTRVEEVGLRGRLRQRQERQRLVGRPRQAGAELAPGGAAIGTREEPFPAPHGEPVRRARVHHDRLGDVGGARQRSGEPPGGRAVVAAEDPGIPEEHGVERPRSGRGHRERPDRDDGARHRTAHLRPAPSAVGALENVLRADVIDPVRIGRIDHDRTDFVQILSDQRPGLAAVPAAQQPPAAAAPVAGEDDVARRHGERRQLQHLIRGRRNIAPRLSAVRAAQEAEPAGIDRRGMLRIEGHEREARTRQGLPGLTAVRAPIERARRPVEHAGGRVDRGGIAGIDRQRRDRPAARTEGGPAEIRGSRGIREGRGENEHAQEQAGNPGKPSHSTFPANRPPS